MNLRVFQTIVDVLLRGTLPYDKVGYTSDAEEYGRYRLVVVKSGFIESLEAGQSITPPKVTDWIKTDRRDFRGVPCDLPVLLGTKDVERIGGTVVVHSDVIALAYIMLFNVEERYYRDLPWSKRREYMDAYDRLNGRSMLAFRSDFLHRPVLDEYGEWLRGLLALPNPQEGVSRIYLTHDVDNVTLYRRLRGVLGAIKRSITGPSELKDMWKAIRKGPEHDPLFTFPKLMEYDSLVPRAEVIYFLKSSLDEWEVDKPAYKLTDSDGQCLMRLLEGRGYKFGWHSSAWANDNYPGRDFSCLKKDFEDLSEQISSLNTEGASLNLHRSHYLMIDSDMLSYMGREMGVTDDFTYAYPDVAGFRAGTCVPYRWLDTDLVVHPTTIMDVTLSERKYMGLKPDDAQEYCLAMVEQIRHFGGEVTLLWHNNSISQRSIYYYFYHTRLYEALLKSLA